MKLQYNQNKSNIEPYKIILKKTINIQTTFFSMKNKANSLSVAFNVIYDDITYQHPPETLVVGMSTGP